jgi:hypothetical protein
MSSNGTLLYACGHMHVGILGGTSEFSENDLLFSDGFLGRRFQNDRFEDRRAGQVDMLVCCICGRDIER